jgi:hypothetical protein
MNDVQRLLTQLASSVASGDQPLTVYLIVDGAQVFGTLIGRKPYLDELRKVIAILPEDQRGPYEAACVVMETAPDLLDTLYLREAYLNGNAIGSWCIAISAVSGAGLLLG